MKLKHFPDSSPGFKIQERLESTSTSPFSPPVLRLGPGVSLFWRLSFPLGNIFCEPGIKTQNLISAAVLMGTNEKSPGNLGDMVICLHHCHSHQEQSLLTSSTDPAPYPCASQTWGVYRPLWMGKEVFINTQCFLNLYKPKRYSQSCLLSMCDLKCVVWWLSFPTFLYLSYQNKTYTKAKHLYLEDTSHSFLLQIFIEYLLCDGCFGYINEQINFLSL